MRTQSNGKLLYRSLRGVADVSDVKPLEAIHYVRKTIVDGVNFLIRTPDLWPVL